MHNLPQTSIFYGAISSSEICQARVTAVAEVSSLFRNGPCASLEDELHTISVWEVVKDMRMVEIVLSDDAMKSNKDVQKRFEEQRDFLKNKRTEDIDLYLDFLRFISNEFSKKVKEGEDWSYKISAAYSSLVLERPGVDGIIYPSVQTVYKGFNVTVKPENVDEYLRVRVLKTQIFRRIGSEMELLSGDKKCTKPNSMPLIWEDEIRQ